MKYAGENVLAKVFALLAGKLSTKADVASLAAVATSGSYNDLSDKPSISTTIIELVTWEEGA